MANHIAGIDHAIVGVRDLEQARASFERLGFRTTPFARHLGRGTGEHCLMFADDHVALCGIVDPAEGSEALERFLAAGEGLWTLALRTAEAWFDPDGFRLYEHDDKVAAFCWTKVHRETEPPLGEIYVIGVDPALHGRGLGRQLTLAGLDWLSDHGIETASLYVDGGNTAALHLYERLGFVKHRSRFAFAGTLSG